MEISKTLNGFIFTFHTYFYFFNPLTWLGQVLKINFFEKEKIENFARTKTKRQIF
jgi:hypothetical protein